MKRITLLILSLALIPVPSQAAEAGSPEAFLQVVEKKLDEIKNLKVENYRLVDGTPDPTVDAIIAQAQKKVGAGTGTGLATAIDAARRNAFASNQFAGDTSTCVNNQVTSNTGVYYSLRDCSAGFKASRAWVQANMYAPGGNYVLLASWGNIDFGRHTSGSTFAIYFSPSGDASEFDWLINSTN